MNDINQIELMYRNELANREQNIRKTESSIAAGLVKIGFELKKIRDGNLYVYADCKDIYEYAEKKFHYDRTTTSKMMKLNDTYSIDGYSEEIKEHLEERLNGLGKTLLIEMMYIPEEDYELITPDTKIADIRELKNAEKQEEEEQEAQVPGQIDLLNSMPEVVPESEKPQKKQTTISDVIRELFHPREMKEYLDTLVNMDPDSSAMKWWVDDFNQSGNRVFNKKQYFLFFYGLNEGLKIRDTKEQTIDAKSYKDFYFMTRAAFGKEVVKGKDVWNQAFGAEYEAEQKRKKEEEERQQEEERRKKELQKQRQVKENQEKTVSEKPEKPISEPSEAGNGEELKKINKNSDLSNKKPASDNNSEEIVTGEVEDGVCDIAQDRKSNEPEGVKYLKVREQYIDDIKNGRKKFTIRRNDKDYKIGQIYTLRIVRMVGNVETYLTDYSTKIRITYILDDFEGLATGYIAMGYEVL